MALREILAKFGFEIDSKNLVAATQGVDLVSKSIKALPGLVGGIAGALGLGAVKDQIDELAQESAELGKAAVKSGVGFQAFQRIQYQTGLGSEQLSGLFRKLQQNIAGARGEADQASSDFQDADGGIGKSLGKKQAVETFKALGVAVDDASGSARPSADVFQDVAGALSKLKDPAQRTALAIRLFGRSGAELLPFLEKSPEAIAELGEQFDAVGGFSDDARKAFGEYGKANKLLKLETKALKVAFVSELAPAITFIVRTISQAILWFKKNVDTSMLLKSAIGLLAGVFLLAGNTAVGAGIKAALAWARAALPIVVLTILVDDLIHFFKGDAKTATEDFINALFGAEAGAEIIQSLRESMGQFISELTSATSWADKLLSIVEALAGAAKKLGSLGLRALGLDKDTADKVAGGVQKAANFLSPTDQLKNFANNAGATQEFLGAGGLSSVGKEISESINGALRSVSDFVVPKSGKDAKGPSNNTVQQTVNITNNITGTGAEDIGSEVGSATKEAISSERRAALNALESRK